MSNIAKLKKQAAEFEQKKQFDRALAKYIQILDVLDGAVDEADVALYNRVGDLLLKQGSISQAVDYYERAVDLYTEGGFFNNAIALCNKILRNAPGRNSVYYKLGKISAQKGFVNDAKQNFLEYADRMQNAGQLEEAFRALKEFADLCPDQDDIRLMLADQLVRKNRKSEAIEQLQTLYEKLQSEGRTREARATVDRMKALDPDIEPRETTASRTPKASDLIFLDVNYDAPPSAARSVRTSTPIFPPVEDDAGPRRGPASDLPLILPDLDDAPPPVAEPIEGLETTAMNGGAPGVIEEESEEIAAVDGLQPSGADLGAIAPMIGEEIEEVEEAVEPLELTPADEPLDDDEPLARAVETLDAGDLPTLDVLDESPELDVPLIYPDDMLDHGSRLGEPPAAEFSEPELILPDAGLVVPDEPVEQGASGAPDLDVDFGIAREQSAFLDSHVHPSNVSEPPAPDPTVLLEPDFGMGELEIELPDELPTSRESASFADALFADDIDQALDAALEGSAEVDQYFEPPLAGAAPTPAEPAAAQPEPEPEPEPELPPVERMRRQLAVEPDNWPLRRSYAESLLEEGKRDEGLRELDQVMIGFERWSDLVAARSVAEEILRVDPNSVKHHQKRVELAFRAGDKSGLVDAYLQLADCLFRGGQLEKSRAVYQRVLELAPDDARAHEALRAYGKSDLTPPSLELPKVTTTADERPAARGKTARPTPPPLEDAGFVNLGDLLRDDERRKTTRMKVDVKEPGAGDQVGFAEMLHMFKQGVAANVDDGDHQSHYDLGVAYKEMGLLDEAISEFQKALRGTEQRVRTYEALGQCFVEKRQYQIAITILSRALNDKRYSDDMLVGVLYLLGTASEALDRSADALAFYQRVFAVDIQFRDVGARLATVERRTR